MMDESRVMSLNWEPNLRGESSWACKALERSALNDISTSQFFMAASEEKSYWKGGVFIG